MENKKSLYCSKILALQGFFVIEGLENIRNLGMLAILGKN